MVMRKKELVLKLKEIFDKEYPDARCSLDFKKPYELLIATQLAAQCTDARVNIVTKDLFRKYKTIEDFANADQAELEACIRSTGFFRNKAKNIIGCCRMLLSDFGGKVPDTMEQLTTLPGTGRKTANIILGDVYGKPSVVVDTHCIRLSNRLGLTKNKDPYKIELDLKKIVPEDYQTRFCHTLVFHGRTYCTARNPKCGICPANDICPKIGCGTNRLPKGV